MSVGQASERGARPRAVEGYRSRWTLFYLIVHSIRLQARGVIIWGAALGLLSVVTVGFFPSQPDQADQFQQLI